MLGTEGVMNVVDGIEVIEWNEIVDSDRRGCLTDINLEACFEEKFNRATEMESTTLNPNKRNHRKLFVEKCEEFLDKTPIEAELNEVEMNADGNKI